MIPPTGLRINVVNQQRETHRNLFEKGVHVTPFSFQELIHEYHIALFGSKSTGEKKNNLGLHSVPL